MINFARILSLPHLQQQFETVVNILNRQAAGATSKRLKLEQRLVQAQLKGQHPRSLKDKLNAAHPLEQQLVRLAADVKTLLQWLSHDVLELAGPLLAVRRELFDFIVTELKQQECKAHPQIQTLRKSLHHQRDQVLAFVGLLDQKLAEIALGFEVPLQTVREVCLLNRKSPTSNPYWERWNQLHAQLSGKFHAVMEAVRAALKQIPRASSLVENLNARLRNYFFLRRTLGKPYLGLLQFFLNHRCFIRSAVPERVGKSPKQLMTHVRHPHWLELLGFQLFRQA